MAAGLHAPRPAAVCCPKAGIAWLNRIPDYFQISVIQPNLLQTNVCNTLHLARQHKGTCALHPMAFAMHPDFAYPLVANLRRLLLFTTGRMDVALTGDYYDASEPYRDISRQVTSSIHQNSSCNIPQTAVVWPLPHLGFKTSFRK